MDKAEIRAIVEKVLKKQGLFTLRDNQGSDIPDIPIEVSARHVHLTRDAVEKLFGSSLKALRALSQPGEFLSEQRVRLKGPNGALDKVAILGPERKAVQAELSLTDARALGIDAPLRLSGDLSDAAEIEIEGPSGSIRAKAAIVAKIHLHLRPSDAGALGLENGGIARVRVQSRRPLTFEDVVVRVRDDFMPALHIDFDEANACMYRQGDRLEILPPETAGNTPGTAARVSQTARPGAAAPANRTVPPSQTVPSGPAAPPGKAALVTEAGAKRLAKAGSKIRLPKGTIITPAAKDVFYEAHCRIEWED
jgi:propanediol utilization protein